MEKEAPYFTLKLPTGSKAFKSRENLNIWLDEVESFNTSGTSVKGEKLGASRHVPTTLPDYQEALAKLSERIGSLRDTLSYESIESSSERAALEADKLFSAYQLVDPDSPEAASVSDAMAHSLESSIYLLAIFTGIQFLNEPPPDVQALAFTLYGKAKSRVSRASATKDSALIDLDHKVSELSDKVDTLLGKGDVEINKLIGGASDTIHFLQEFKDSLDEAPEALGIAKNHLTQISNLSILIDDEVDRTREAIKARLFTDDARRYWKMKKWRHTIFAIISGLALVAALASGIWFAFLHLLPTQLFEEGTNDSRFWTFLLMTFFFIWIGRLVTRLYHTQVALAEDAAERQALIDTYVALTAETAVEAAEREIVFRALFRPASKGLGTEDGSPHTPGELVVKWFTDKHKSS